MYKEYLKKIMENTDELTKDEIYDVLDEYSELMEKALEHIKVCDADLYDEIEITLYELAYGEVLTEDMAKKWVHSMKPYGEKWSMNEIKDVVQRNNLDGNITYYYVYMNMYYNDFYETIKDNTAMYLGMARDKIKDIDAIDNYIYKEYKLICEYGG